MGTIFKVAAAGAFLLALRYLAGRPRGGGNLGGENMNQRIMEIQRLSAAIEAEPDAAKKKTLVDQRAKLAAEELAKARADAAIKATLDKAPQPPYPVGLVAKFGKREATITRAWQDDQGWHFKVDLKTGELFGLGSGTYDVTEAELRQRLADELGALAPGQLYPRGIYVMRGGKGGVVDAVERDGETFRYTLRGWGAPVGQGELAALLRG